MKSYEELEERRTALVERMTEIRDKVAREKRDVLTVPESDEFFNLDHELRNIVAEQNEINERAREEAREAIESGKGIVVSNPSVATTAAGQVLETEVRSGRMSQDAATRLERLTKVENVSERSAAESYIRAAGSAAYLRAFGKLMADPQRGHQLWTEEERQAYAAATEVRTALSLTTGVDLLPLSLDPTINLTNGGFATGIRSLARTVQTVTNSHRMITSAGVTAEFKAELVEAADATPSVSELDIPVHLADAYAVVSYELAADAAGDLFQQLQNTLFDGWANLTNQAYVTGTGSGQPKGFVTAVSAVSGSVVTGTGTEAVVSADVFNLQAALPPRWQNDASWAMSLPVANALRQLETTNGALEFPELRNSNPSLLGRPVAIVSEMATINPAVTATDYVIAYGDFDEFVIVDRLGMSIELIPNVIGANQRPIGARGILLYGMTGSDVLIPNAFRLLSVATTA